MAKKKRPDPVSYLDDTPVPMMDFWERAIDFHEAYKNLREQRLFDWARYSLIGHAVEVGLKAYLIAHGWKRKKLRTHVYRVQDKKRNMLVYLAISDKLIDGSPQNAISTVPIMPWGAAR
jgi:hypothetical protein